MTLKIGDRGNSVRDLQNQLRAKGFDPGSADGIFGNRTADAVRRFQAAQGLTVDAKVGPDTTRALQNARNSDSFTPAPLPGATNTTGRRPYQQIQSFVESRGFHVTSTTGGHHLGRAHREGRAVDVRTRDHSPAEVERLMRDARAAGYTVIDERRGGNSAWSGPHIHIQMN